MAAGRCKFDQTGSGDGSKEVLLLYYCPVTKLFGHDGYDCDDDGDDDDDDGDDIYIMMKFCMYVCYVFAYFAFPLPS